MDSHADSMLIESELIVPVSIEFRNDLSPDDFEQLCRLCGNSSPQLMPIFSADGNEHNLPDKIREHLPIIKVSKTDVLPLSICYQCASTLISWHELYYACKDADLRLNEIYSRFKLEKIEPEENLIEIDDDVDFSEHVDSYEPVEFPVKPATPLKPEVIIPSALSEETTRLTADFSKTTESNVCSKPIEIPLAVDNEARKSPSADTKNKSTRVDYDGEERKPEAAKRTACVVCRVRYVDDSEFCDDCTDFKPIEIWLQSPPHASSSRGAENYDRFLVIHENGIKYMQCDQCSFICRPLVDVFSKHYGQHSSGAVASQADAAILVKCTKCDASFADDATLSAHYEIHATRRLACKVCNRTFNTKIKLQVHKRKHSTKVTTSTIKCGMCDKEFKTKSGYNHHRANVCVEYRCDLCQQIFLVRALLNAHLKKEHGVDAQEEARAKKARQSCVCSVCGKRINESALSRHMQLHSEQKPYQCDMCGKQFRIKWSLREHIMIEIGMKDYVCEVCGKKFVIQAYLNKHMRVHLMCDGKFEGFQCEVCGKKFAEEWRVKEHQRNTHHADKARQYACDLCDRKFERKWLVRSHKRAAHDEFVEQYQCEHCAKKFTEKWMIKLHLQTLHGAQPVSRAAPTEVAQSSDVLASSHVAQKLLEYNKMIAGDEAKGTKAAKKFECELCGKTFATKQGMKNHVYAELNMRKYVCEICGKRYNWWMGLKEHSIMTHGTKEFACRLCSKEFPTKKRFKDHMTVHSEDRPYNCECGNAFKLKRYLKKHQKRCCSLKVDRKPAVL